MTEHEHHHHSSGHHHSDGSSRSQARHESRSSEHKSSSSRSGHHHHHHHHEHSSTTGGYRMAGPADTTPITIVGMEDTAKDDRLSLHAFDPNAPHSAGHTIGSQHAAHRKKALRRKFRQNFLKILLVVVGISLSLVVLWLVIRTVGAPKLPSNDDAIIGKVSPIEAISDTLPST